MAAPTAEESFKAPSFATRAFESLRIVSLAWTIALGEDYTYMLVSDRFFSLQLQSICYLFARSFPYKYWDMLAQEPVCISIRFN